MADQNGWISYKYASTPEGLDTAAEVPLFGAAGIFPLFPYNDTKFDLSSLHPDLSNFTMYSEPGSIYKDGIIYLSFLAVVLPSWNTSIVLIKSVDPGDTWSYVGTYNVSISGIDFAFQWNAARLTQISRILRSAPGTERGCRRS